MPESRLADTAVQLAVIAAVVSALLSPMLGIVTEEMLVEKRCSAVLEPGVYDPARLCSVPEPGDEVVRYSVAWISYTVAANDTVKLLDVNLSGTRLEINTSRETAIVVERPTELEIALRAELRVRKVTPALLCFLTVPIASASIILLVDALESRKRSEAFTYVDTALVPILLSMLAPFTALIASAFLPP